MTDWRRLRFSQRWLPVIATAAVVVVAGIGLLVWGLLRTGGGERAGVAAASASVADLLGCYREYGAPATSLSPSRSLLGARVRVGGRDVEADAAQQILVLLGAVEPIYFGVRGTPGTRIGEPGRLAETTLQIDLSAGGLTLKYVRPGPVAPYGLLFDPALINSWELITMLSPAGYAQLACTVPPEFDQGMANLGFEGYEPDSILETRAVPLAEAQRECCPIDRIEVWREGELRQVLTSVTLDELAIDGEEEPIEPFVGEPLNVDVWYRGADPFPEAVKPARYLYYTADASGSDRGVLLQIEAGVVLNGSLGRPQLTFYPVPELDRMLREAATDEPHTALP